MPRVTCFRMQQSLLMSDGSGSRSCSGEYMCFRLFVIDPWDGLGSRTRRCEKSDGGVIIADELIGGKD